MPAPPRLSVPAQSGSGGGAGPLHARGGAGEGGPEGQWRVPCDDKRTCAAAAAVAVAVCRCSCSSGAARRWQWQYTGAAVAALRPMNLGKDAADSSPQTALRRHMPHRLDAEGPLGAAGGGAVGRAKRACCSSDRVSGGVQAAAGGAGLKPLADLSGRGACRGRPSYELVCLPARRRQVAVSVQHVRQASRYGSMAAGWKEGASLGYGSCAWVHGYGSWTCRAVPDLGAALLAPAFRGTRHVASAAALTRRPRRHVARGLIPTRR